ncbi:phosphogluconate 2-dehydrogenase [Pseudomonas syringae]|uniref:D-isomer specific 2-hydroxyacid dehydrogenase protein n=1 Tax=Pseudomonas syringae pv. apii TaxID=81036 RepID=A0A3M3S0Z5_9PSED|nr:MULTISPECIES: D-isomer specific 2-hydroxyacid dehydrogenase family protein [Pseudomonas syringae group]POD81003.1 hypothetical protein BKM17_03475 [Pseudomonas syringae group genomosp. 3]RMN44214.1 D-isomer specific 2-hydroxyacid dehydrogenase protein [Pseudomonas syringae pv. apii]RMN44491.1 D-isomer specific 2-hydroxyacid dehydrogenase protein [Pseudomonas syringae pv. apii]RMO02132.1 D-isomer specific 2-hydroxyacid dehydrogenase protein [Pseudomonas syringae pv. apii]SDZ12423.1 phosphogl
MNRSVLVTGPGFTDGHFESLRHSGFEVIHKPDDIPNEELVRLLIDADAYILGGAERVGQEELVQAKKLKCISFVGTGAGSFIDLQAAEALGIAVTNTPGIAARAVAEHTLGLMLGLRRRLFDGNGAVKRSSRPTVLSSEVSASKIGVVGMGVIGSCLARMLTKGMGVKVYYASRTRKRDIEDDLGLVWCTLQEIFATCDIVSLLVPLTPDTRFFVNDALLKLSPKHQVIINTADANLIDPASLKAALQDKRIEAAAFDGYYVEPIPAVEDDPFGFLELSDDVFVITPHGAAKTPQTWQRMIDLSVANLINFNS